MNRKMEEGSLLAQRGNKNRRRYNDPIPDAESKHPLPIQRFQKSREKNQNLEAHQCQRQRIASRARQNRGNKDANNDKSGRFHRISPFPARKVVNPLPAHPETNFLYWIVEREPSNSTYYCAGVVQTRWQEALQADDERTGKQPNL